MADAERIKLELEEIEKELAELEKGSRAYKALRSEKVKLETQLNGLGTIAQGDGEQTTNERVVLANGDVTSSMIVAGDHNEITNIARMFVYLTTGTGSSSQEIQGVLTQLEKQLETELARDMNLKSKEERYIAGLGRAIQTALGDAQDDSRRKLLHLTTEWALPVIENCRNFDDHHSPYGQFCFALLQGLYPNGGSSPSALSPNNTISSFMDWIFTSHNMLVTVPGVNDRPIVYLGLLSKYFPTKRSLKKPEGYYLAFNKAIPREARAEPTPILGPLGGSVNSLGNTALQILCMPGEYVGMLDPSIVARRTTLTAEGEKVTGYEQNVVSGPKRGSLFTLILRARDAPYTLDRSLESGSYTP